MLWQARRWLIAGRGALDAAPAGGSWQTNVAATPFNSEDSGYNGYTIRVRIEAAQLANTGGSQVRVTFQAGTSEGFKIAAAYIGMAAAAGDTYDFEATPAQLLFSGAGTTTISANATKLSDAIAFSVEASKALIVSAYCNDGSNDNIGGTSGPATGWSYHYKNASDAATVNATGYTTPITLGSALVTLIESL